MQAGSSHDVARQKEDDDDESLVGVSSEKTYHCALGDVISEKDVKVTLGERGIARISSSEFFVHRVSEVDAKSALKEILRALASDWRDASFIDDDMHARVLPIAYHSRRIEKRFRRWRDVSDAVTEEPFDDWPLEDQVRSADWLIQQFGKGARGPIDYVDSYLAKHPYQPSDRSQHELRCLAVTSRLPDVTTSSICRRRPSWSTWCVAGR